MNREHGFADKACEAFRVLEIERDCDRDKTGGWGQRSNRGE